MELKLVIALVFSALLFFGIVITRIRKKNFNRRVLQLFKSSKLAFKEDQTYVLPKYQIKRGWLYLRGFSTLITPLHFTPELLMAFSNLFTLNFTRAEYEGNKIILKSSRAKCVSFEKNHPKKLQPLHCFLGTDEDGTPFELNTYDLTSFFIAGGMGSGKSTLANRIRNSLIRTSGECRSYIFCKNRNDFTITPKTIIVPKDDKELMLNKLMDLRDTVINRQIEIEKKGFKNGLELEMAPIYVIADECHSYLKQTGTTKEERDQLIQIISIFKLLLLQGRSSLIYLFLIMPSAEKEDLDLNPRDCAFYFSSRLNSPRVSENLFGTPAAFLMPREKGLFCFTDKNTTKIVKVADE